jgi:hypothetical protein
LEITADSSFTVTFAREGSDPVTLTVEVGTEPKFRPNPVFAYLAPIDPGLSASPAGPPGWAAGIPVQRDRIPTRRKPDGEADRRERELDKIIRGICRGC